jgi:hypothetical protein
VLAAAEGMRSGVQGMAVRLADLDREREARLRRARGVVREPVERDVAPATQMPDGVVLHIGFDRGSRRGILASQQRQRLEHLGRLAIEPSRLSQRLGLLGSVRVRAARRCRLKSHV